MKALITGTSGTGKSTITAVLRARGLPAIESDFDCGIAYWEHVDTGEREQMPTPLPNTWFATHHWKWDIDVLQDVLSQASGPLFVCGDSRNKADSFSLFDRLFVLHLDDHALVERLTSRTNNPFGARAEEQAWALAQSRSTVAELTAAGALIIDASQPPDQVVDQILQLISAPPA